MRSCDGGEGRDSADAHAFGVAGGGVVARRIPEPYASAPQSSYGGGAFGMVAETSRSTDARAQRIIRSSFPDVAIPEVSITEYVLGDAARRGDKPAIIDGATGRTLSYAQLVDSRPPRAAGLAAHGMHKGDVLGIFSPNVPEYAIAFHAAASLGGISTTVNPLYTPRELAQQLSDCTRQLPADGAGVHRQRPRGAAAGAQRARGFRLRRGRGRDALRQPATSTATSRPRSASTPRRTWSRCRTRAAPPACPRA